MRNLFLVLLFANLVYFFWARWVSTPTVETGVILHKEADLVPLAELAPRRPDAPAAPVCLSVGPFEDQAAAEIALVNLTDADVDAALRTAAGQVFIGHWVQVVNIDDRAQANRELKKLKDGGIAEAYIVGDAASGFGISLGLFSELPRAERVLEQAQALGASANITDRTRDGDVHWLDVKTADPTRLAELLGDNATPERVVYDGAVCP